MVTLKRQVMCYCCELQILAYGHSHVHAHYDKALDHNTKSGSLLTTHKQALLLQPSLETRLIAYCAACSAVSGRAPVGLKHSVWDRALWQSCSWLSRDTLSHCAKPQMPLTTFHNTWIGCSMPLASAAPASWSVSSNWHKQTNKKWVFLT